MSSSDISASLQNRVLSLEHGKYLLGVFIVNFLQQPDSFQKVEQPDGIIKSKANPKIRNVNVAANSFSPGNAVECLHRA